MMGIVICIVAILVFEILTPFWWWIMVVPFVYSLLRARSGWGGFRVGMFSAGLLWLAGSVYMYFTGGRIIAGRVAQMFNLGISWLMILLTTVIAAVAAGFAGLAGYHLRSLFLDFVPKLLGDAKSKHIPPPI